VLLTSDLGMDPGTRAIGSNRRIPEGWESHLNQSLSASGTLKRGSNKRAGFGGDVCRVRPRSIFDIGICILRHPFAVPTFTFEGSVDSGSG
jgi:hypothetical protein